MSSRAAKAEAILGADQDDDIYTQIEKERAELRKQGGLTPVTHDSFVAWKDRKAKERQMAEVDKAREMLKVPAPVCLSVCLSLCLSVSPCVSLSVCVSECTLRVSACTVRVRVPCGCQGVMRASARLRQDAAWFMV